MEIEQRKSQRPVQSKKYNEYYTFSLSNNNEFDQAINESLKSKPEQFDIPSNRTRKRIQYNNFFDDSDSDRDDGDWRNSRKKQKKKRKRAGKKNKQFRERKIRQKDIVSETEQLLRWRNTIEYQDQPLPLNCYQMHLEDSINALNLDQFAPSIQAMLMTPDWKTAENPKGKFTIDNLEKLTISKKVMKNGIVWLWAEKEYLSEIISIMSRKSFVYIENVNIIQMSAQKSAEYLNQEQRVIIDSEMNKQIEKTKKNNEGNSDNTTQEEQSTKEENKGLSIQPIKTNENGIEEWTDEIDLIQEQLQKDFNVKALDILDDKQKQNCFFKQCRQIILMFRRFDKENKFLELRHQRTADVFFDMSNEIQGKISWKAREFMYNQIETLLPKALLQYTEDGEVDQHFQMLELWGDYRMPRLGWITICEKSSQINQGQFNKEEEKKSKRGRKKKVQTEEEQGIINKETVEEKKQEESNTKKGKQSKPKKEKQIQKKKIQKNQKV